MQDYTQNAHAKKIAQMAHQLRLHVLRMIGAGRPGHLGGSFSAAEVVSALYFHVMRLDPKNPAWADRDRFILSKGHAALVQYAALAELGFFDMAHLDNVKGLGSVLQGHPDANHTPGVEACTGSLGQGLSIGCGMALGLRLKKSPARVYVMLGDGELGEGQIWEAAMAASAHGLDNVCAILDANGLQATGAVAERFDTAPHAAKWQAFGWHAIEIDGHDAAMILRAFSEAEKLLRKPTIIIAKTVKGRGVSFAEGNVAFHNGVLSLAQHKQAVREVSAHLQEVAK